MSHSASIAGAEQDLEVSIDWLVATLDSMDDTEETHAPHALDGTDSSTGTQLPSMGTQRRRGQWSRDIEVMFRHSTPVFRHAMTLPLLAVLPYI